MERRARLGDRLSGRLSGSSINASVPDSQLLTNAAGSAFGALQDLHSSLISRNNIGTAVTARVSVAEGESDRTLRSFASLLRMISMRM
jgi:hypothetical protein